MSLTLQNEETQGDQEEVCTVREEGSLLRLEVCIEGAKPRSSLQTVGSGSLLCHRL